MLNFVAFKRVLTTSGRLSACVNRYTKCRSDCPHPWTLNAFQFYAYMYVHKSICYNRLSSPSSYIQAWNWLH